MEEWLDIRGSATADAWCGTSLFTNAQIRLCRDFDARYCVGAALGTCADITAVIQNNCGVFQLDSGGAADIRVAAQCIDGQWIGGCQQGLPCGNDGPSPLLLAGIGLALLGGVVALERLERNGRIL